MRVVPVGPEAAHDAAAVLREDGLVVLPTDTVYGVAVRAARDGASGALAAAKGRPSTQAVAVLVGSFEQVTDLAELDDRARAVADAFWPGPLTMVVPRRAGNDWELGGRPTTIGVRWPDDRFTAGLALRVGPLAVTSANRHGEATPTTADQAAAVLTGPIDLIVDGGSRQGAPSTVVALTDSGAEVLRIGTIPARRLEVVAGLDQ